MTVVEITHLRRGIREEFGWLSSIEARACARACAPAAGGVLASAIFQSSVSELVVRVRSPGITELSRATSNSSWA
jgi:hypothetical protein